jgi:hypothetical protein
MEAGDGGRHELELFLLYSTLTRYSLGTFLILLTLPK